MRLLAFFENFEKQSMDRIIMSGRGLRIISDAQLVDLRLQAWEEAQRKRASRVRKIDSDDVLPEPAHPALTAVDAG